MYLLCQYLRAVPECDRDLFVPADRDELDHATPKAAVKLADGAVLCFQYLDEVRQPFALRFLCRDGGHHLIVSCLRRIIEEVIPLIVDKKIDNYRYDKNLQMIIQKGSSE